MLRSFGVKVESHDTTATITPPEEMIATDIVVPGDISSATFFIVAGLITPKFMYPFKKMLESIQQEMEFCVYVKIWELMLH